MLVAVENLSFSYTDSKLFDDLSLYINEGEKIGLIGANGCGKSTLIQFLITNPTYKHPKLKLGYLPQNPVFEEKTILEVVSKQLSEEKSYEAKAILSKLGILNININPNTLSGGEKKKVALSRALVSDNDLLILDEPTNHLDLESIDFLEKYLIKFKGALLLVTHDRYFLEKITNRILELEDGKIYSYPGNYESYLEQREIRIYNDKRENEKKKAFLRKEIEWVKSGVQARETKSKSRLEKYYEIKKSVSNKMDSNLVIKSESHYLGKKTIEAKDVSVMIGENVLFSHFNYLVLRDDRIGIIGSNSSGKTTLLKTLIGQIPPSIGEIVIGETVKIGYLGQELLNVNPEMKVIDYINEKKDYLNSREMLESFLFPPALQQTELKRLSGGERRRLEILRILIDEPNILVLDEPTNDLDIKTLGILETYLESFKGAVVLVSHDRYFLDKVCDHVLVISDRKITEYLGGYSSYKKMFTDSIVVEKPKEKVHQAKISYKEKLELEELDKKIGEMEKRQKDILKEIEENPTSYLLISKLQEEYNNLNSQCEELSLRYLELLEKS